ncbi:hypothetical protein NDU88_012337 [Pleurodeles waltl]|uniref:Uncharacterized protein n=1 Tax=Pleurodeles waltl TaxID=8319 RepID=A0AAV7R1C0_PLEWA|nr:hypothetical protein NDU88_012337 [Pleurodeles waltl]
MLANRGPAPLLRSRNPLALLARDVTERELEIVALPTQDVSGAWYKQRACLLLCQAPAIGELVKRPVRLQHNRALGRE